MCTEGGQGIHAAVMPPSCLAVYWSDEGAGPEAPLSSIITVPSTITMAVNSSPPKQCLKNFRTRAQSRIQGLILELKDIHEALLHEYRQGTHILHFRLRLLIPSSFQRYRRRL